MMEWAESEDLSPTKVSITGFIYMCYYSLEIKDAKSTIEAFEAVIRDSGNIPEET